MLLQVGLGEFDARVLAEAAADPDEGPLTAERVADVAGPFLEEGQPDEAGVAALCENRDSRRSATVTFEFDQLRAMGSSRHRGGCGRCRPNR